jgi:hypothetical protein
LIMMPDCIKITHAQPMTTPTIRTALERLIQLDDTCCPHNVDAISGTSPWDDAIADIRAVLKAEPQAERPSEKDLYDLAPEPRPTFQDAIKLAQGCHDYSGGHSGAEGKAWHGAIDTVVAALKRAAVGPWDSQTRAVYGVGVEAGAGEVAERGPVAVRERLRIVMAGLGLGYMAGHNDTVESTYADPDEFAADYAPQVLGELDPLPAPQAGEVEEVDPDHANRLGTIIPSDIKQLADQLDRDGLRLIEVGYANESLPTRDTGLRVVRASYILQQQQAELATLKDDGWAKAMTDLVDQIGGEGPYLWEWGASIPTPKKVVEYLREHIDYLEHLGRVQGALTALKVDPVAEGERPWEREGWCNEKGDFWAERINREGIAEWEQANRNHLGNWMVRCLPHNAIPLPPPQAGEVEA